MPTEVFTIYWILKEKGFKGAETMANQIEEAFRRFPHWRTSEKHERKIREELYGILLQAITDLSKVTDTIEYILKVLKNG